MSPIISYEEKLLDIIKRNPGRRYTDLLELIDFSRSTLKKWLKRLKTKNKIIKRNEKYYIIPKEKTIDSLSQAFEEKSLAELTKMVFFKKYEYIEEVQKLKGKSGKVWTFDAIVKNVKGNNLGIFIRDWKREISVTQLRQLHNACMDVPEIQGSILVCNIISDFCSDYSSEFGITLLSKRTLISKLKNC